MGWEVTSFSKKKPKPIRTLKEVNYLFGDLTKKKDLKVLKKKFDYIVNAAGVVDHSSNPKVYKAHYLGCKNLANFFLKKKIKLFLQVGSCVEYGPQKSPQKEDYKPKINDLKSMYSKGKLAASKYLMELYDKYRFPVVIFRLYLNYGPNQDFNRFLPVIIDGCIRGKKFPCSSGIQYRSFTFIDDLVRAMVIALKKTHLSGNVFNIGNNKPVKIKRIVQYIKRYVKKGTPLYGKIKFRKDEIKHLYPNISKAKLLLNWQPKVSFSKGLSRTINYYKSNIKF